MVERTPKQASYKRIVICSDGTWLASDVGDNSSPSNVAKLCRAVATSGPDAEGNIVKQVVYYHSGLGSGDLPLQKAIYGGIGWGLDVDLIQIYDFICNNYQSGDELFFFGFSRGAFTVRSVAGLVCDVGILSAVHMPAFAEMWKAYRANTDGEPFRKSEWYLNNKERLGLKDVRIKVVGVWDTVGALGIPDWPLVNLAMMAGLPVNKEFAFHNTNVSNNLDYAFQALAINEKRITFPPTLWHKTSDGPAKDLQQCWFPGIHANIGGQRENPAASVAYDEIGHNTFAWMVDNVSGMLTFEDTSIKILVEEHHHALNAIKITNGWGCGPIADNFSGLQGAFFWLLGRKDRTPGAYPRDPGDGTEGATNEYFHPIARIRKDNVKFDPPSLHGYQVEKPDGVTGWQWAKKGVKAVPEYVMRPEKKMSVAYEEDEIVKDGRSWNGGFGDPTSGEELRENGVEGVLCFSQPWPSMARMIWGAHQRFIETYLSVYKGYYFTGDGAYRDEDGYYWFRGRVDDVINVSGHRLSIAEIEAALIAHPEVAEAAVVGVSDDVTGQSVNAFVSLKSLRESNDIGQDLKLQVRKMIGPFAAPKKIIIVPDLPKTRSGKIMRRVLRKILTSEEDQLEDITTLSHPSVVKAIVEEVQK